MLTLDDLSEHVAGYRQGREDFDDFVDWFRDNARGYSCNVEVGPVISAVEAALSKYYFQDRDEGKLHRELANAVRPFVRIHPDALDAPQKISLFEKARKIELQSESKIQVEQWLCA